MIKSAQKTFRYDSSDEEEDAIFFPYLAVKCLRSLRFWAEMMGRIGRSNCPSRFTLGTCKNMLQRMEEEVEHNSEKIKPDRPEEINTIRNWMAWWDIWDNYMSQKQGGGQPISLCTSTEWTRKGQKEQMKR